MINTPLYIGATGNVATEDVVYMLDSMGKLYIEWMFKIMTYGDVNDDGVNDDYSDAAADDDDDDNNNNDDDDDYDHECWWC